MGASKSTSRGEVSPRPVVTAGPSALAASGAWVARGHADGARRGRDGRRQDEAADAQRKRDPRRRPTSQRDREVDGGEDGQREGDG